MLRILHYVGAMNYGGVETLLINLYRKLDKTKFQFDFLVHNSIEAVFDQKIALMGGTIYKLDCILSDNPIKYIKSLRKFLWTHTEYKIIHAHQNALSGYLIMIAKKQGQSILISHSHQANYQYHSFFSKAAHILGSYYINKYSDYLLGCSKNAISQICNGISDRNISIFKNAVDIQKFKYCENTRINKRKEMNLNNNTMLLGNVGSFSRQKNHLFLLEIFYEYRKIRNNTKLLLIGDGIFKSNIVKKCIELGIINDVILLGQIENVNEYYNSMDMFVFPSLYEGLGIVAIEAQANGLPCVITESLPEEIDIGAGLINRMSLKVEAAMWAKKIDSALIQRKYTDISAHVQQAGYDIESAINWLQEFYMHLYTQAKVKI